AGLAQSLLNPQGEVGSVNTDEHIRLALLEKGHQITSNTQQFAQTTEHLYQPHHRQTLHRHLTDKALSLHAWPADTDELGVRVYFLECSDQASAQGIARRLT